MSLIKSKNQPEITVRVETTSKGRTRHVYRVKYPDTNKYYGDGTRKPVLRELPQPIKEAVQSESVPVSVIQDNGNDPKNIV